MYAYQFMDGTWRIAKLTSSKVIRPVRGEALTLWDGVYSCRRDAELAMKRLGELVERSA